MRNLRIDSACDTDRLACLTAASTSATRSGSVARSPTDAPAALLLRCFQPSNASGSMVISAPMNGLASPTTIAWLISGCARSWSSSTAGATFLPPAVTMSLLLAAGDRQEAVVVDRAEIAGLEPAVGERLVGGLLVAPVAAEHHAAAHQQLAVVGDAHAVAGHQLSDGPDLEAADLVDGDAPRWSRSGRSPRRWSARRHGRSGPAARPAARRRRPTRGSRRPAPRAACGRPAGRTAHAWPAAAARARRGPGPGSRRRRFARRSRRSGPCRRWRRSARRCCTPSRTPAAPTPPPSV